MQKNIAAA